MVKNAQNCPFPSPHVPLSGAPLEALTGQKTALALGALGAGLTALLISAHSIIGLVGAVLVLVLSAVESEPFLLFVTFLTPFAWSPEVGGRLHDVPIAVRSLATVSFFLSRFWRGRLDVRGLFRSSLGVGSLFFLGAITASLILVKGHWTQDSWNNLYRTGSYVGFFFLVSTWADSPKRIAKILSVLLYSTIITAAFGIWQEMVGGFTSFWLYLYPPNEYFGGWDWRPPSFLQHPNHLAGYLNLILPFALACYVLGRGKWKKLGGWTLGLGILALLCTQSLGGLLAFASILVLAIFCFVRNRRKGLVYLAGLCALLGVLYLLRQVVNPAHTEESVVTDAVGRALLWQTAGNYFLGSPVLGVGWGNFVNLYSLDLASLMPPGQLETHNIYLQFLAETGLVGFVAFFYLVVQSVRQAWHQWRLSSNFLDLVIAFGVLGALLSVLVHGFVDCFLFSPQYGTLLWLLLALLLASARLDCKPALDRGVR